MILAIRPVDQTTDIERTAETLVGLTRRRPVRHVLETFMPGVAERYSGVDSASAALQRAIDRPDVTAYLLLLIQGERLHRSDATVYRDGTKLGVDIGVIHENRSRGSHDRIVGMSTAIGKQSLSGLFSITNPSSWLPNHKWTNLAMWCDPRLSQSKQLPFARHIASRLAPPDSFVTVDEQVVDGTQHLLLDPSTPLIYTGQFIHMPGARPKGSRMSRADGIVAARPSHTYVHTSSKEGIALSSR